jgi:LPS export ABC transporter protein LptC
VKTSHRIIFALLVVALAGALTYWVTIAARRRAAQPPPAPPPAAKPGSEVTLTSPELRHTEGGKLAWKVILDEVSLESGGGSVAVKGLREGIIYDKAGLPALRVTAKSVKGDTLKKDFEMQGSVVVTSPRGMVITTEQVKWFNDQQKIQCPGVVKMKGKSLVIATTGLDYLLSTDEVKCPNQVRMYSGNNRVVGRSLTYNLTSGIADITGGVQMVINPKEARQILKELGTP